MLTNILKQLTLSRSFSSCPIIATSTQGLELWESVLDRLVWSPSRGDILWPFALHALSFLGCCSLVVSFRRCLSPPHRVEALESALDRLAETGSAAEDLSKEQLEVTREVRMHAPVRGTWEPIIRLGRSCVQGGLQTCKKNMCQNVFLSPVLVRVREMVIM